jgi:malonate transporter and related proteins
MEIADLVLPVFAIIVTGWLAGALGYISQSLADGLVHFAYNVAMPALLFVTIAQEPAHNLLEWRISAGIWRRLQGVLRLGVPVWSRRAGA